MTNPRQVFEEMNDIFEHIGQGGLAYHGPNFSDQQIADIVSAAALSSGLHAVANSINSVSFSIERMIDTWVEINQRDLDRAEGEITPNQTKEGPR